MKSIIYVIGLVAGIVGIAGQFIPGIPVVSPPVSTYLLIGGFVVLAIGYMTKRGK